MKTNLLLVFLFAAVCAQAQYLPREISFNYMYANPQGSMAYNIASAHGLTMNYGFLLKEERIAVGLDIGFSGYGHDRSRQEYQMDDGTMAPMDIVVSNNIFSMGLYGRYYLTSTAIRPYLSLRTGYSWFTTDLSIYDPDDSDQCEPVDSDVLYNDGTVFATLGTGVKLNFRKVFKGEEGRADLDLSYNLTTGGQVSFMNVNGPPPAHHHHTDSDVVTADFRNTQTQVVHAHHVGYLYNNPLRMSELRVGVTLRIGD